MKTVTKLLSTGIAVGLAGGLAVVGVTSTAASSSSLTAQVKSLKVKAENNSGYVRTKFGSRAPTAQTRAWLIGQERRSDGTWLSLWDGKVYRSASGMDADHTVALGEAWGSGARSWTQAKRVKFANDLVHRSTLNLITARLNRVTKNDKDPAEWLPSKNRCEYVREWVSIKKTWGLSVNSSERSSLLDAAGACL